MIDSETRVLAGILPDLTLRMEKAQLRLISATNFDHPQLRQLWQILDTYYDDHLAVIPEWVLKEKMKQLGYNDSLQITLVEYYQTLSKVPVSEHEFNEALNLMKQTELSRKTEEAIVTAREILHGEYYDETGEKALKGQESARQYLSETLQGLETIGTEAAPEGEIKADIEKIWAEYLHKEANPDEAGGVKYGIEEIDEITGGIRPGELALIAGFTGVGKSHWVVNLVWNAMRAQKNVLMFTTETTREEMEIRILARHSRLPKFKMPDGLDAHDLLNGLLDPHGKEKFREVLDDFKKLDAGNLWMVQMPPSGLADYVYAKAHQYNRLGQIDLIVVDSINLLRDGRRRDSKREMLEDMLQDFKRFASAFDNGRGVGIASPWQMSRTAWREAMEAGGVYTLASLSDTSEAEKSPSQIISLFKDGEPGNGGRLNVQVLKSRSGQEMGKVSYPYDYRNSFIGTSSDSITPVGKPQNNAANVTRDITGIMGV